MKERIGLVILTALSLSACNEQNGNGNSSNVSMTTSGHSLSVIGQLRPKADPSVVAQIHQEEEAAARERQAEAERQAQAQQQEDNSTYGRDLPSVNTGPISSTTDFYSSNSSSGSSAPSGGSLPEPSGSWAAQVPMAPPPPPAAASYGINYGTPSPGFVPPPPVQLSATGQAFPFGAPPGDYANPYQNPYGYGAPPQAAAPQRAKGSLFGGGGGSSSGSDDSDDDSARSKKKDKPIQVITPTGMESRSPYKQRDDLRILWKGAMASSLAGLTREDKFAEGLSKVDISLPTESSKGSLSVAQRQADALFKNGAIDKKIFGAVKKSQTDLTQAYYRFLYAYNKFFLTQQQVAARKQELDLAESQAEKQRATVDLAQSQQEADASKEDLRSSQSDLASIVGAQAARSVIQRVSGVSPSLESLASADPAGAGDAQQGDGGIGGFMGSIGNAFGFGKKSKADAEPVQVASDDKGKERKDKEKKEKKGKGAQPVAVASKPQQDSAPSSKADAADSAAPAQAIPSGPVSFELKDVKTTPHKTMLRVVVRNAGGDNFSFDADSVSVAEGNNRLTEAAVRAEFDSTMVQPNQEVTGTITIYGRPWNDKLTVSLSDGGKPILMHR